MRTVEPEPWSLGVRFRHEPRGLRRYLVRAGSPADGGTIGELDLGEDAWISLVIRHGQLVPVQGATRLQAGDEVVVLTDPERTPDLTPVFTTARPGAGGADPAVS
jgi:potassium/hydrogen antiporter